MTQNKQITWEPMPGKIVVKVVEERDHFRSGGIIVKPPTVQQPRTTGRVVAVYEPFTDVNDSQETTAFVEVGDLVIFGKHSGIELEFGDERVVCIRESEILTKVVLSDPEDASKVGVAAGKFDHLGAVGDLG
jgi:co-chaperonin GroES (HSP10)